MIPKAFIFDFDGVIVDTEPIHLLAFQKTLKEEGIYLSSEDYYSRYLAYDDRTFFFKALNDYGKYKDSDQLNKIIIKKSAYFDELIKDNIKLFDGVYEFIISIAGKFRIAIGSGAIRSEIINILNYVELFKHFEYIVSADEVEKCKPDPEVYLKVLKCFNNNSGEKIEALDCIVFEDSLYGIQSAKDAGMKCIAVANSYDAKKLKAADCVVESFLEVDEKLIGKL